MNTAIQIPTFRTTINKGFQTFWVLWINQVDECGIHPTAGFHRVQPTYDDIKLHIIVITLILNFAKVAK